MSILSPMSIPPSLLGEQVSVQVSAAPQHDLASVKNLPAWGDLVPGLQAQVERKFPELATRYAAILQDNPAEFLRQCQDDYAQSQKSTAALFPNLARAQIASGRPAPACLAEIADGVLDGVPVDLSGITRGMSEAYATLCAPETVAQGSFDGLSNSIERLNDCRRTLSYDIAPIAVLTDDMRANARDGCRPVMSASRENSALLDALQEDLKLLKQRLQYQVSTLKQARKLHPESSHVLAHYQQQQLKAVQSTLARAYTGDYHHPGTQSKMTQAVAEVSNWIGEMEDSNFRRAYAQLTMELEPLSATLEGKEQKSRELNPVRLCQSKSTHPIIQSGESARAYLHDGLNGLQALGVLSPEAKQTLLRDERQWAAFVDVLNQDPAWREPIRGQIPVTLNGHQQIFSSEIYPAACLEERPAAFGSTRPACGDPGYAVSYHDQAGAPHGVSSGVFDHPHHARNLKASVLYDAQGQPLSTVIGHGVLDMAKLDPESRARANQAGAREVLCTAWAMLPSQVREAPGPVKVTHVSVNLTTADELRSSAVGKFLTGFKSDEPFAEKDYTESQFAAFDGASATPLVRTDKNGDQKDVRFDCITFSFGINKLATGGMSALVNAWPQSIIEHNNRNMSKFIGGENGAFPGRQVGGYIGDVLRKITDEVENPQREISPEQRAVFEKTRADLVEQAMVVRDLYVSGRYRYADDGDAPKMAREILMLQTLAQQALSQVETKNMAATSSSGCKSDKDRGMGVDAELKTEVIAHHMGVAMPAGAALSDELQTVRDTVALHGGGLKVQQLNVGIPGSKYPPRDGGNQAVRAVIDGYASFARA